VGDFNPGIVPELMPPTSTSLTDSQPEQALESKQLEHVKERVDRAARRAGLEDKIQATVDERGLEIRLLTDGVLFDSGQALLKSEAGRVLEPIAQSVLELRNPIRVEGHTDSRAISTAQFPSNYELSSARALSVVHYLRSHGVPGRRLQGVAFGEFRPRGDNATEAGRAENRRIEVLVLRTNGSPGATPAEALGG
jgi:chemotaxis protein MotB